MKADYELSPRQLFVIYAFVVMGTANFFAPAVNLDRAGRDGWLSILGSTIPVIIILLVLLKLAMRYPNDTFPVFVGKIIGKYPGKILSLLYAFFLIVSNAAIFREFIEFAASVFLPETPREFILLTMIILVGFLQKKPLSTLGNAAVILAPLFFGSFAALFLLPSHQYNVQTILPLLEKGIGRVVRQLPVPVAWGGEVVLLVFYYFKFASDKKESIKMLLLSSVVIMLFRLANVLAITWLLFPAVNLNYPVFTLIRALDIKLLRHMDALILFAWTTGVFIKAAAFQGAFLIAVKDTFQLNNYKMLVFPSLFIIYAWALGNYENVNDVFAFIGGAWPYFGMLFMFVIPLMLLIISYVRGVENGTDTSHHPGVSGTGI